jgi:hypothetical protein
MVSYPDLSPALTKQSPWYSPAVIVLLCIHKPISRWRATIGKGHSLLERIVVEPKRYFIPLI